jgi:hypothetical protein
MLRMSAADFCFTLKRGKRTGAQISISQPRVVGPFVRLPISDARHHQKAFKQSADPNLVKFFSANPDSGRIARVIMYKRPHCMPKLYLTERDYAGRLGIDPRTLDAVIERGAISPAGQLTSGRFIFEPDSLISDSERAGAVRRNRQSKKK